MKTLVIIAFVCLSTSKIFCQDNLIVWNEKQPLQWNDFSGPVKDTSEFDAESFAEVKYNYNFKNPQEFYFDVFANFNKNFSWSRKENQSPRLLKHEQLHFDIAELFAMRLKQAFDNYTYSKNFKDEIQEIFLQKKIEYHLMQQQYDEETYHSMNKEKQKEWEKMVSNQLNEYKYKFNYAKK